MQQANIINIVTNKYEPQQKHRLGMVSKYYWGAQPVLRVPNLALSFYYRSKHVGAIIESDARPTGMQLKREAKLLTVIGINAKHADCRIIFMLQCISNTFVTNDNFSELIRKISPTYNSFEFIY